LFCERKNPPELLSSLGWDVYVFSPRKSYKWVTGPWGECKTPILAEANKELTDQEKQDDCPQFAAQSYTDGYNTEVWRTAVNGVRHNGYCYHLADVGQSCTESCEALGTAASGSSSAYPCNEEGTAAALPFDQTANTNNGNHQEATQSCIKIVSMLGFNFSLGYNWDWCTGGCENARCIVHDQVTKDGMSTDYDRFLRFYANTEASSPPPTCSEKTNDQKHRRICACGTKKAETPISEPSSPTSCSMTQMRDVKCVGSDQTAGAEALCLESGPKPQQQRTCWGTCGVQRSCEELAWAP
jgi:hypothetical protein